MKPLPDGLHHYKTTPAFDQDSVPKGLLRQHKTKAGVWARIRVLEGQLLYRILSPNPTLPHEEHLLDPDTLGLVEPTAPHEVQLLGPVRFQVEFLQEPT